MIILISFLVNLRFYKWACTYDMTWNSWMPIFVDWRLKIYFRILKIVDCDFTQQLYQNIKKWCYSLVLSCIKWKEDIIHMYFIGFINSWNDWRLNHESHQYWFPVNKKYFTVDQNPWWVSQFTANKQKLWLTLHIIYKKEHGNSV